MDISTLYTHYLKTGTVTTDSRNVPAGSLFFALRGENHNGNLYAKDALAKGAGLAVVDDAGVVQGDGEGDRYVVVKDSLQTLQQLARYHRDQLTIPVIGLTGSNGKTTTKELIRAVLEKKYRTFATKGNLNNHIGVPLSVLSIDSSIEIAVIEMGANHVGEIALLSDIANPSHGLITNIGKAHIGMFGGYENIVRAKSELYHHLIKTKGTVWINSQDPVLMNMAKRFKAPLFFPAKGDYYHCEFEQADPYLKIRAENGELLQTKLTGKYNFDNVAVALCIGKYFGVPAEAANRAIAAFTPANMRSEIVTKGTNTIILDAYNANPSSMKVAIENLAAMKDTRKVVILGDMAELGDESPAEHNALGELVKTSGIDEVFFCGTDIEIATKALPNANYFRGTPELKKFLQTHKFENATILIKGSRKMKLEDVVEEIL